MSRITVSRFAPLVVLAASAVACANAAAPPPAAPPAPPPPADVTQVTVTAAEVQKAPEPESPATINVAEEIVKECKIKFDNVEVAPKFGFKQSALPVSEKDVLTQIARCVSTGPLAGRTIHLVGRADPRGGTGYNFVLGAKRAAAVRDYLEQLGIPRSTMTINSRGKLEATGLDEASWARDRRVDVVLER